MDSDKVSLIFLVIIAIEIIFMYITGKPHMFGLAVITFGLWMLFLLLNKKALNKKAVIIVVTYCMIWGILLVITGIQEEQHPTSGRPFGAFVYVFALGIGVIFLWVGIWVSMWNVLKCTKKIDATFDCAVAEYFRKRVYYTPQFSFTYQGRKYCNISGEIFSERKIKQNFQGGETYNIYINPKDPKDFCVQRKINGGGIVMVCMGILFVLTPFLI